MRLFEFDDKDPLRTKLVAVTSQLKSRYLDTGSNEPLSTSALLEILKSNDIIIDKSDIYDMVNKEPLSNIIDDIKGDEVIFKGQHKQAELGPMKPGDSEKIVSQMANRAANV